MALRTLPRSLRPILSRRRGVLRGLSFLAGLRGAVPTSMSSLTSCADRQPQVVQEQVAPDRLTFCFSLTLHDCRKAIEPRRRWPWWHTNEWDRCLVNDEDIPNIGAHVSDQPDPGPAAQLGAVVHGVVDKVVSLAVTNLAAPRSCREILRHPDTAELRNLPAFC